METPEEYHDDPARPVGEVVVEVVAAAEDEDPMDAPVLYESIDPDALEAVTAAGAVVTFQFAGYDVRVDRNAEVHVQAAND